MAPVPIPFAYRSSAGRYGQDGAARLMNLYAEEIGDEGKVKAALYAIGGMSRFATLTGSGGIRAMLALSDDELIAVAGRVLSTVDAGGGTVVRGGVVSDGLVTMARNRANPAQVMITCDGSTSMLQSGSLTTFTDADLQPANSVCNYSGYFVFTHENGAFTIAGPDSIDVDALDTGSANTGADALLRGVSRGTDVLLFGTRTIEAWQDTGGDPFPLSRVTSVKDEDGNQVGILSAASIPGDDLPVLFISADGVVRQLGGYQAVRVSNHEIERLISADASPSTIRGFYWTERGHRFYTLTGSTWTKTLDMVVGGWHDRKSKGLDRWRCGSVVQLGNRRIFGDIAQPRLYLLDADLSTEDGDEIDCHVICPPVYGARLPVANVVLDVIRGVGLNSTAPQNLDPVMLLDYSEDGAKTWSPERQIAMGRQGQSLTRLVARRLGRISHVGRSWRMRCTASVVRAIMGARMNDDG